ncbi:MAG: zf-HC2 domain-containing protein [Candidatus Latescibacterota bacterium]
MTCRTCRRWMSVSLDGDLETSTKEAFEEHLSECFVCRNQVHTIQTLQKRLAHLEPIRPSSHFHFALRARLLDELGRNRRLRTGIGSWRLYRRPILVIASAAFLIVSSIGLIHHQPDEDVVSSEQIVTHYVLERISPSGQNASISLDSDSVYDVDEPETLSYQTQTVSSRIQTVSF